MPPVETMSLDEKYAIAFKAHALRDAGDEEGYMRLMKSIPMPAYMAKINKEKIGADYLIKSGWNLSEAEAEFGPDWLNR